MRDVRWHERYNTGILSEANEYAVAIYVPQDGILDSMVLEQHGKIRAPCLVSHAGEDQSGQHTCGETTIRLSDLLTTHHKFPVVRREDGVQGFG